MFCIILLNQYCLQDCKIFLFNSCFNNFASIHEDEMTNLSTCFIATTRCESDLKVYRRQGKQCNIHNKIELLLLLLLDIFSNICILPLKENKISTVPGFVDNFFSGIYKFPLFANYAKKQIFIRNLFTILLYNQIQIYFHIWLKISVKIKILLVGNALLSLVNLYAQVTKKPPIFY